MSWQGVHMKLKFRYFPWISIQFMSKIILQCFLSNNKSILCSHPLFSYFKVVRSRGHHFFFFNESGLLVKLLTHFRLFLSVLKFKHTKTDKEQKTVCKKSYDINLAIMAVSTTSLHIHYLIVSI